MKPHGTVEVYRHSFLTSTLDGGEWSASLPGCFAPEENAEWVPESVWTVSRGETVLSAPTVILQSFGCAARSLVTTAEDDSSNQKSNSNCSIHYVKFTLEKVTKPVQKESTGIALHSFISALDGVVVNAMSRPLYPWNAPVPTMQEAGWAPGSI
jgi:hypothetical protein